MGTQNIYQNIEGNSGFPIVGNGPSYLSIQMMPLFNSMTFNKIFVGVSGGNTTAKTLTWLFGMYTLNGTNLDRINSASKSIALTSAQSWITLITSASSAMTPGEYYLALLSLTAGNSSYSFHGLGQQFATISGGAPSGGFVRGTLSVTTNGIPANIATSNIAVEGATALIPSIPYVVLTS